MTTSTDALISRLSLPIIAAPMLLASSKESVVAACRSGIVGSYPALNQRSTEGLDQWLTQVEDELAAGPFAEAAFIGPHCINLVVHHSNKRLESDLAVIVQHKVPLIITSLGANPDIIAQIHAYGGLIFHDVISVKHAQKALQAGVDGIVAVTHGAGGHAGTLHPFPFIHQLRALTDKPIILAGAVSTGRQLAAAIVAGASLVSAGTRFLAVDEASVQDHYKELIVESEAEDIVYTPRLSGINANFLKKSIAEAGVDLATLEVPSGVNFGGENRSSDLADTGKAKVYTDIWSAGQGVGSIRTVLPIRALVAEMRQDFDAAIAEISTRYPKKPMS